MVSQVALVVENLLAKAEDTGDSGSIPGGEMATQSSILAWRIPWTEKPEVKSMGVQRVVHDWSDLAHTLSYFPAWKSSQWGKTKLSSLCQSFREPLDILQWMKHPGWLKHSLESRLLREISITSDKQMIPPLFYGRKRRPKEPLEESERGECKSWLKKLNIQKTKFMASGPITSRQIDGETMETVTDFIFLSSKITADGHCSHEIERHLLPGRKAMINLDSILKSRNTITLPTKAHLVKVCFFQKSCMDVKVGL